MHRCGALGLVGALLFATAELPAGEQILPLYPDCDNAEECGDYRQAFVGFDIVGAYAFSDRLRLMGELTPLVGAPEFGFALEGSVGVAFGF